MAEVEVILRGDSSLTDQRTPLNNSVTPEKMTATHKGIIITTSANRATEAPSPVEGQRIYETDTDRELVNIGTPAAPVWRVSGNVMEVPFSRQGALSGTVPSQIQLRWQVPAGGITIVAVLATLFTPSTSGAVIADLNRAVAATPGTFETLYTTQANRPSIAVGAYGGVNPLPLPDVVNIAAYDWLQADIDAIGTGAAGFVLQVRYVQNV